MTGGNSKPCPRAAKIAGRLRSPFSGLAFMAVELVPNALEGIEGEVRYPPPFEAF
jgi:putative acetyltransferase